MKIGILGAGRMGTTLGGLLARRGHEIALGSRNPARTADKLGEGQRWRIVRPREAVDFAATLIVATPWPVTLDTLRGLGGLAGKTVIDITNPIAPDISRLVVGADGSAAERIAETLPGARVVKAFNTIYVENLSRPDFSGEPAQILCCGDDPGAKRVAATLIGDLGFVPIDCGPLRNARYIEALAMLWIELAFVENRGTDFSFRLTGELASA